MPDYLIYNLSNLEKYELVSKANLTWFELRNRAAIYLKALRSENKPLIDYFESLGSDIYKIMYNHHTIEYHNLKPFQIIFNKNGYIEGHNLKFLKPGEQIEIKF